MSCPAVHRFVSVRYDDTYDEGGYTKPGGPQEDDDLVPNLNRVNGKKPKQRDTGATDADGDSGGQGARAARGRADGVGKAAGGGGGGGGAKVSGGAYAASDGKDRVSRRGKFAGEEFGNTAAEGDDGDDGGAAASATGANGRFIGAGVCFDFQRGTCSRGESCRYVHAEGGSGDGGSGQSQSQGGKKFGPDKGRGGRVYGSGGGGRGGGRGGGGPPKVDLAQRNEKSLRARAKKDKNKATNANHNRKKGADKKARGGMGF